MKINEQNFICPTDNLKVNQNPLNKDIEIKLCGDTNFCTDAFASKTSGKELAQKLYKQIKGASLNSKTIALLAQIDKNNVVDVIKNYSSIAKQITLAKAIDDEWGLDVNTVKQYVLVPLLDKAKELSVDLKEYQNISSTKDINKLSDSIDEIIQLIKNKQKADEIVAYSKAIQEKYSIKEKFDTSEFSLENIKRKYPADKFKIKIEKDDYITDIEVSSIDNKPVVKYETNNYYEEGDYYFVKTDYDESGRVLKEQTIYDNYVVDRMVYDYTNNKNEATSYRFKNGKLKKSITYNIIDNIPNLSTVKEFDENGILSTYANSSMREHISYNSSGFITEEIKPDIKCYYYENGNLKKIIDRENGEKFYNSKGALVYTKKPGHEKTYEIVNYYISALEKGSENDNKFKKNLLSTAAENVSEIIKQFADKTGKSLTEEIQNSKLSNTDKTEILSHITKVLEERFEYDKNYIDNNSKVDNAYYQGDEYAIKFNGYKAEIYNKTKKQKFTLDLDYLLKDTTIEDKIHFAAMIQKLPGQVLEDLSIECCGIMKTKKSFFDSMVKKYDTVRWIANKCAPLFGYSQYYTPMAHVNPLGPWINSTFSKRVFTHELGHLIDFGCDNCYLPHIDSKTFDKEREAKDSKKREYASENRAEMFAEVYRAMMLGDTKYLDRLSKYYPQSIENVKKEYENIRNTSPESRNEWKHATELDLTTPKGWIDAPGKLTMKTLSPIGDVIKSLF